MTILDLDDRPLGERHIPEEPLSEYYLGLRGAVKSGDRLKVIYKQAGTGFVWLYGYVHVK